MPRDHSSADAAEDGVADAVNDTAPDADSKESDDRCESGNSNTSGDRPHSDGASPARSDGDEDDSGRVGRPLVAGATGLLAGVVGGIAATTIAPGNLFLTILLIVVVILVVTLGTLRVLAR